MSDVSLIPPTRFSSRLGKRSESFRYRLLLPLYFLPLLACVRLNLAPPPGLALPSPTPLVWPTLSPRPAPLILQPVAAPPPACSLPDLGTGQHLSASGSYTETEKMASRPMTCRIRPGSCAYARLASLTNPTLIFKGEEGPPYDGEDALVHPALVEPLARLNELVQAEWPGQVRLRITDAYDSLYQHDPEGTSPEKTYSLHYEGRAVDLTTSPVYPRLYPRLCALAACAGFTWVLNEGTHCHASLQADNLCETCR